MTKPSQHGGLPGGSGHGHRQRASVRPRTGQGTRTGLQAPGRCQKRLVGLRMRPRAGFGTG